MSEAHQALPGKKKGPQVDGAQQSEYAGEAGHSGNELQQALPGKKKEHQVDGVHNAVPCLEDGKAIHSLTG
jgi:hypothetical protein